MPGCNLLRQAFPHNGAIRRTTPGGTSSLATGAGRDRRTTVSSHLRSGMGRRRTGYGQQPGYGPPAWSNYGAPAPVPTSQQAVGWVTFAVIGLLGLLGAILTLTLWINLNSAVSRASDVCNRYSGEYSNMCRQHIQSMVPSVPMVLVICLFLIIGASLAVCGGAVMLFLKRHLGQFLILGGGIVMLMLAIGCEARYGTAGRVTYDLIAGVVVAVTAGLMFIPVVPRGPGTAAETDRRLRARRVPGRRAMALRPAATAAIWPARPGRTSAATLVSG